MDRSESDGPVLLVTRPEPAARRFLEALRVLRGGRLPRAVLSPALRIRPLEVRLPLVPAGLILTSENGAARVPDFGLAGLPAWCVGPRTRAVAEQAGLGAREAGPDAEALVAALVAERPAGPLLHLRGEQARGDVVARLREAGLAAEEAVVYRQEALAPSAEARAVLEGTRPTVLPLFSPRSAAVVAGWGSRAPLHLVAMSPAVAEAAAGLPHRSLRLAARPDGEAMLRATARCVAWLEGMGRPD
ncbi:uroporphyrinogen-III synthase [Rubellimicrobium sp. CFH 75288]|uniref:uroporphyrinogen-III synthase n=1 Tax=Rubellimicrobium sp. CFH 75288 TaxID=2697034 RepID=UPI001411BC32|nr:uroporphyrinogen-III synthase [Rubellimicrobium sp. CFH 75288]NAZ37802.1 uroporphyrinogen-III synthase [Rubellimicrobium sp. CFH 75288]